MKQLRVFAAVLATAAMALLSALPGVARANTLQAGDIVVIGWSALTNTVRFLPLVTIPAGTTLVITDRGWDNATNAFTAPTTTDGTITWTTSATITAGTVLSLQMGQSAPTASSTPMIMTDVTNGNTVLWSTASLPASVTISGFTLTTGDPVGIAGDQIFIYQDTAANPYFIYGLNNSSGVVDAAGWNTSVAITLRDAMLPNGTGSQNALTNGSTAIGMPGGASQQDNVQYIGPITATDRAGWLTRISNVANWLGDITGTIIPSIGTVGGSSVSVMLAQTIAFGANPGPVTYSSGGTVTVSATATSGLGVIFSSSTSGVCTISGTTVTIVTAGTCVIAANQAGNGSYSAAPTVMQSIVINKASQTISFGANPGPVTFAAGGTFAVAATASSGLTPAFSSLTTGVCTIAGTTVTIVGAGTCTIAADELGNVNYNAALQVTQNIVVNKASQTITFGTNPGPVTFSPGGTFTVSATASSALGVLFSSSTPSVCSIAGNMVTIITAGTCTIAADQSGSVNFNAALQALQNIVIGQAAQTIAFGANPGPVTYSSGGTFTVSATATSGLGVTFSSSTSGVCTISGTTVTIVAAGTCTIAADQAGNVSYTAALQAAQNIVVNKANQVIAFGANPGPLSFFAGGTFAVSATGGASGNAVSFGSLSTGVCTVSGSTVTMVAAGTCVVAADQLGNTNYNAALQAVQNIVINKNNQTISFGANPGPLPYSPGGTFAVSATASSGLAVTFSSLTAAVCTVSGSTATIVAAGTCTIAADQAGDGNFNAALQATQNVAISKLNQTISFGANPGPLTFSTGGTFAVSANASSGLAVSFSSLTAGICTASGTTVTMVAAGTCIVAADQAGDGNFNAAPQATQNVVIGKANQTVTFGANPGPVPYSVGGTFAVSASASSGLAVSFGSLTAGVCTVVGTTVTILGAGTCTVTADQAGNGNFNAAAQATQNIVVSKANQTIAFGANPGPLTYAAGGTFAVSATASSGLTTAFSSLTSGVCTVAGATVTIVTAGTCTIAADQVGNGNYNAAPQATQSIVINKVAQTIAFGANPGPMPYAAGGTFAVSATGGASGNAVTFTSTTSGVCTVSGSTVTIVTAGTCTIAADQAGNVNYNAATQVTQNIVINKAGQTLAFGANPGPVTFSTGGTFAVSATASSGLAATFSSLTTGVCTAAGSTVTIVAAGTCTVAADQAGNVNYNAAVQVTQNVVINKANQTITFGAQPAQTYSTGGTFALSPAATASSGLAVAYTSTTAAVCTVAGTTVTMVAAGTCILAADQAGNGNFNAAAQVTQNIVINKGNQTITFGAQAAQTFSAGGTFALAPVATASSALAVSYSSTTTAVCTIAGTTVTMVTAGTCTIAADQAGNGNFNAAPQATQNIAINKANQTITFGAQAAQGYSAGGTFAVSPLATASSGLAVTYSSTTTAVCTIAGTTVTIVSAGTCILAADQAGDGSFNAAPQVTQNVVVNKANQTITFGAQASRAFSATPFAPSPAASASSGLAVVYGSATPAICTVSGGLVTAVSVGTCTLTADQAGNTNFNAAAQATQSFTITQGPQTINFAPLANRPLGSPAFTVSATATSGLAVSFASLTAAVCTTSGTGGATVTIVALGTCTLRASQAGNANYAAATPVDQSFSVVPASAGVTLTSSRNPAPYGSAVTLSAFVGGSNPTGTVTFSVVTLLGPVVLCNAVPLVSGSASCVAPGKYQRALAVFYLANYSGDVSNQPAAASLLQLVGLNSATLSAAVHPAKPIAGRPLKITALVTSKTLDGKVTFNENGVTLPGCANVAVSPLPGTDDAGVAVCNLSAVAVGSHNYVVTYPHTTDVGFEQVYLLDVRATVTAAADYTDMWWAGTAENGWGVSIAQHGNAQFVALYVYDAEGKPRFYVMPGGSWNAAMNAYTGNLYQPTSSPYADYDASRFRANAPVGSATITFTSSSTGTLAYTIGGVSGVKSIQRQVFGGDDGLPRLQVNDLWWGGGEQDGWGVNIAQQGRTLFSAWYTYGADGKVTWFVMPGGTWTGTTYEGDLYATTGSPWLGTTYDPKSFVTNKVGTMRLDFNDQDNATMTYTINGITQIKAIVRQPY